jgi:ABC-2 type transport system permease protein
LGNSIQTLCISGLFGCASAIAGDRQQGTLWVLLASPASRGLVLIGRALAHLVDAALGVAVTLSFTALWIGLPVRTGADATAALAGVLATIVSTSAFGLLLGMLGLLTRETILFANLVYWALFALAGVTAPVSSLPGGLEKVSQLLPLTYGLGGIRLALAGDSDAAWTGVVLEGAHGACAAVAAMALYRYIERAALRRGDIDLT